MIFAKNYVASVLIPSGVEDALPTPPMGRLLIAI